MRDCFHLPTTLLLALGLLAGCSGDKKDKPDDKKGDSAAKDADKLADRDGRKPDDKSRVVEMAAKQYQDEFARDPKGAAKKYANARVELTGVMAAVKQERGKPLVVRLQGGPGADPLECVPADGKEWRKAMPGQPVKVSGRPDPKSPGTTLTDARITPTGAIPARPVTAAALAEAFAADAAEAEKKYPPSTPFVITGEFESVKFEGAVLPKVFLKVPKDQLYLGVEIPSRDKLNALKKGQRVKAWVKEVGYGGGRVGGHLAILYEPAD